MSDKPIFDHTVIGWNDVKNEVYSTYTKNGETNVQVQWGYDGNGDPNDAKGQDRNNHSTLHPGGYLSHSENYFNHEGEK